MLVLPIEREKLMKTVSLKLAESLDEKISAVAQERGESKSAVVREALEAYLKNEKEIRPGSCLEMAKDLIGIVKGPPDLSFHKRHLKGFGK
jgi:metal-responsive CopG/Arc/MetJ family transcriptional regulator